MTMSVDDLVSSMSSNHIGQEATDIAALQAQLSQTLFTHPFPTTLSSEQSISTCRNPYSQPCNTPITRTPSASFSRGHSTPRRRSSVASRTNVDETVREGDESMEDDERMVEDILMPSSPTLTTSHFGYSNRLPPSSSNSAACPLPTHSEITPNSSTFTCTDPFYMAQLQAENSVPQSVFAQAGRPAQHSPFMMQHRLHNQHRRDSHGHPPPLQLDTHSVSLVSYDR